MWTHKNEADHAADPHYNGNGKPFFWTCHKCGDKLLLYGKTPPITGTWNDRR